MESYKLTSDIQLLLQCEVIQKRTKFLSINAIVSYAIHTVTLTGFDCYL